MKVLTVVGNRPQFIKAAAVSGLLRKAATEVLVHTGQHYDDELSRVFFSELGLPRPDRELGLGGGSNSAQTARMLAALEPAIAELAPDAVLVYGDTNSTLAGALAAGQARVPLIHIEAGMRSFDRAMPEELNRVLADHIAELLLCASQTAVENLRSESVAGDSAAESICCAAIAPVPPSQAARKIPTETCPRMVNFSCWNIAKETLFLSGS